MSGRAGPGGGGAHRPVGHGLDPERVAQLIEGKLDPAERAELFARLDGDPMLLRAVSDAAIAAREATGVAAVPPPPAQRVPSVEAIPIARRASRRPALWGAIAAGLLIASLLVNWRVLSRGGLADPAAVFSATSGASASAADVASNPVRPATRGTGTTSPGWVAYGSRLADLALLAAAGDSSAASIALEMAADLRQTSGGGAIAASFDRLAMPMPHDSLSVALRSASDALQAVGDRERVRAGFWVEVARLSAAKRQSSTEQMDAALRRISRANWVSERGRTLADALRRELRAGQPDWTRLSTETADLLTELSK